MTGLRRSFGGLAIVAAFGIGTGAARADMPTYKLSIKDHKFDPGLLEVPADQKIKLLVRNLDPTPEEFESTELNREKIVPSGSEVTVYIGPLKAGEYPFMGDFHQATAQGRIVAKAPAGQ